MYTCIHPLHAHVNAYYTMHASMCVSHNTRMHMCTCTGFNNNACMQEIRCRFPFI